MKLSEIFDQFMNGTPIQREESWGGDVFIKCVNNKIKLCRKKADGKTEVIEGFAFFDRYFSLDDLTSDDWVEVKQ